MMMVKSVFPPLPLRVCTRAVSMNRVKIEILAMDIGLHGALACR